MSITLIKNFDLRKIKLDLHKELNNGLDIVALDIQKGIDRQSQFGKPIPRNEESTLKKKKAKGWGTKSLIAEKKWLRDSGKMIKTKATREHQIATLLPKEERIEIAYWLQEEGVETKHGIKHYEFWGISDKADEVITQKMFAHISREVDNA